MRFAGMVVGIWMVAGCTSQPVSDQSASSAAASAAPQAQVSVAENDKSVPAQAAKQEGSAPVAQPASDAKAPAAEPLPRKAGYRVVNKDGKQVYCTKDVATGSRITTVTECFTPEQLERRSKEAREAVDAVRRGTVSGTPPGT